MARVKHRADADYAGTLEEPLNASGRTFFWPGELDAVVAALGPPKFDYMIAAEVREVPEVQELNRAPFSAQNRHKGGKATSWKQVQASSDAALVEMCMQAIAPVRQTVFSTHSHNAYHTIPMPEKTLKIHQGRRLLGHAAESLKYRLPLSNRGREYNGKDMTPSIHTAVTRYGRPVKLPRMTSAWLQAACIAEIDTLFTPRPAAIDEVVASHAEYIEKCVTRSMSHLFDCYDTKFYEKSRKIDHFPKKQTKADLHHDAGIRYAPFGFSKGGQGISAQPPAVNMLAAAWVRCAEKIVTSSLKPGFSFCYGKTFNEFDQEIRRLRHDALIGFENDFTQFDALRGLWSDEVMKVVYRRCGVDSLGIKLMQQLNNNWLLDAGDIKLQVRGCLQSGRADTLFSNTVINALMVLACYKFKNLRFMAFQGDDSAGFCDTATFRGPRDLLPYMKPVISKIPTLVGYLLADGLYLNLPRAIAKLASRKFIGVNDLVKYQTAVRDWLRIADNERDYFATIVVNARHYQKSERLFTPLMSYLYWFSGAGSPLVSTTKQRGLYSGIKDGCPPPRHSYLTTPHVWASVTTEDRLPALVVK